MGSEDGATSIALLEMQVHQLTIDVEKLTAATKELVDAWNAAGTLLRSIKWASTLATALTGLWAAWHFSGRPA